MTKVKELLDSYEATFEEKGKIMEGHGYELYRKCEYLRRTE